MSTPTNDNFQVAALRHYKDAELLKNHGRSANAGQLFGIAAECGIKAVIQLLNHNNPKVHLTESSANKNGLIEPTHLDLLDNLSNTNGRLGSGYKAHLHSINNFANWSVHQRYWGDTHLPNSLEDWHNAAKEVMKMLQQAQIDQGGSQ